MSERDYEYVAKFNDRTVRVKPKPDGFWTWSGAGGQDWSPTLRGAKEEAMGFLMRGIRPMPIVRPRFKREKLDKDSGSMV